MNITEARPKPREARRVLVTGAGSGIGRALALLLAERGDELALVGRRPAPLERCREEALAAGARGVRVFPADIRDEAALARVAARLEEESGALDGVVNNAGRSVFASVGEMSLADWQGVLDVNLTGTFVVVRALLPLLRAGRAPAIVNVASTLGEVGLKGAAAYCAAKAGVLNFTRALALDLGEEGIRVAAVAPGPVRTEMLETERGDGVDVDERLARLGAMHPLGRIAEPEEVARAIAWLLSPEASFVSGTCLRVDGGLTAGFRE